MRTGSVSMNCPWRVKLADVELYWFALGNNKCPLKGVDRLAYLILNPATLWVQHSLCSYSKSVCLQYLIWLLSRWGLFHVPGMRAKWCSTEQCSHTSNLYKVSNELMVFFAALMSSSTVVIIKRWRWCFVKIIQLAGKLWWDCMSWKTLNQKTIGSGHYWFFYFYFFYLNRLSSVVNFTETKISYEMLLTVNNYWMDWLQFSARIPACSQRMNPDYFKDALTLLMWPYHEVNICDI